jgi:hypothetical protein
LTKHPKPFFARFVLITFLSVSRRGEFENTINKISGGNLTLVFFWPLAHPPTTGVADFVFVGPLWLLLLITAPPPPAPSLDFPRSSARATGETGERQNLLQKKAAKPLGGGGGWVNHSFALIKIVNPPSASRNAPQLRKMPLMSKALRLDQLTGIATRSAIAAGVGNINREGNRHWVFVDCRFFVKNIQHELFAIVFLNSAFELASLRNAQNHDTKDLENKN